MVLHDALGAPRTVFQELAGNVHQKRENSDADPAGRERPGGPDRAIHRVISCSQTLRRRNGTRSLSARASRTARGEASAGHPHADVGVVRQASFAEPPKPDKLASAIDFRCCAFSLRSGEIARPLEILGLADLGTVSRDALPGSAAL